MTVKSLAVRLLGLGGLAAGVAAVICISSEGPTSRAEEPADKYAAVVQPFLKKYCLDCHSTKAKKGSLDLERFVSLDLMRKDVKPWQQTVEMLEAHEMPPKEKPQPTAEERKQIVAWVGGFLESEAKARSGDPGYVPLRRLSNAEYDTTIRDLTGVDLRPTREFPADGAAGEGFTNAAEALTDISPALLTKYLNAAKETADHALLLPDGVRFSPTKTRRDWTDESTARLRQFYTASTPDGRLHFLPYLAASVKHREALTARTTTVEAVALNEKLNPKYLSVLWQTLTDKTPSSPLDSLRTRWRTAAAKDVPALAAEIAAWQIALEKTVPVGSYRYGNTVRQVPNDPAASETQPLRLAVKPAPGQSEVVLYLMANDTSSDTPGRAVWQRPRFEGAGKPPLLLRDYAQYGPAYEVDLSTVFADSAKYLAAVAEATHDRKLTIADLAKKHSIDITFLKRWIDVLVMEPLNAPADPEKLGRVVPAVKLELLEEKNPPNDAKPVIKGWRKKGTDLPVLITNSSNTTEQIPGRVVAHGVSVHPMPQEFVAVVWTSPIAGSVQVQSRVAHAHPACGNGVAWWLEHRRGERATIFAEGAVDLGGAAKSPVKTVKIEKGDSIILAVDAKDANHICDMTEIGLTITPAETPSAAWNLEADIADTIHAGNPHADRQGNKDVWSFVRGPSRVVGKEAATIVPPSSVLGHWREAAADPKRLDEAKKLAAEAQALLTGPRPSNEKDPNRVLFDSMVSVESKVLQGLDLTKLGKPRLTTVTYGLAKEKFDKDGSLMTSANTATEVRLPAALFRDREFVVEGKLAEAAGDRLVQFQVSTSPPNGPVRWDSKSPIVASPNGTAYKQLLQGHADFRRCFPTFICFPEIVPTDETVTLKMYHREDEPLKELFLNDAEKARIDKLWAEHRFISQQPLAENKYLPQFIGFVTQDQPKELLAYFEGQRPAFQKRADDFEKDFEAAIPKQWESLLDFASRAYRRPLIDKETAELLGLYKTLRAKGSSHEEAFRGVLSKVLVSPAFLFRIEKAPAGTKAGSINDWELATRLSYFLTSSGPDDVLRREAASGRLRDPKILAEQTQRLLKDDRVRALAIEFGTQWLHVRGFDERKDKNEKLFPTFDAKLRQAIYEETILFFQDLFQNDRRVTDILDSDSTYLNETLAKHYGIPGVTGPHWWRVDGIQQHGRGGILGLASVQSTQSGASRTSPVLRGNWVVETLLGEKLPRPPANVPQLPEEEGVDKLTTRQQVEKHARLPECAVCHVRIDPFGFALEKYDPIGRRREKDLGGLVVDTHSKLKDGTEFDGLDGLRTYLLTKKKDAIVRLFSKKLLGYAVGRSAMLSDTALLDEMVAELNKNGGRLSAAVLAIVRSPQFRMVRGVDGGKDE